MTLARLIANIFFMESGNVVEYIDRQKIICAVVLDIKKQRFRLLNESNKEVNLSSNRLLSQSKMCLDLSQGRDNTVKTLKKISTIRHALIDCIDIKELWEVLNTEHEWIDLSTMTEFCFPNEHNYDHESAVVRAFFRNRFYFKFDNNQFFPNSKELVEQKMRQTREAERKERIIEEGSEWLKKIVTTDKCLPENFPSVPESEFIDILKSAFIFEKESRHYQLYRKILTKAGIHVSEIFNILVKLFVFDQNENLDIYRYHIPTSFPDQVIEYTSSLNSLEQTFTSDDKRIDLTNLPLMTIDGQSTQDYDDALSIQNMGDHYRLGIHIVDIGHFIKKGDIIDQEALSRGSSIYMPDQTIPMLPPILAEGQCSLKAGEIRPAISTIIRLTPLLDFIDYDILPTIIKVDQQLSYYDANIMVDNNKEIGILHNIGKKFRRYRLSQGAVQISLPVLNIWINKDGEININRINRESPSRMLVSELMIMANWLMARFLSEHGMQAIFRSQPGPKERLYKGENGTLFEHCMQRRLLSRFVLSDKPEHHSGLGLNAYVTATSPIRKYFDLLTQRQIRAILGLDQPYTNEEINNIIQMLANPMSCVTSIQRNRNRYWLLKYLEKKIGQKEEAVVLFQRKHNYQILLSNYMLECTLPLHAGISLKPEDLIRVTIQHVNARDDVVTVYMG